MMIPTESIKTLALMMMSRWSHHGESWGHDWAPWALWLAVQYCCSVLPMRYCIAHVRFCIAHEILYCPCEVLYGLLNIAHLVANVPIIWDPYVPPSQVHQLHALLTRSIPLPSKSSVIPCGCTTVPLYHLTTGCTGVVTIGGSLVVSTCVSG